MARKSAVCLLTLLVLVSLSKSEDTWDKVKGGLKVAYDEVHCQFHKLKELVNHHEHDVDPCEARSTTTTTTADPRIENFGNTENPYYNNEPTTPKPYGWQL